MPDQKEGRISAFSDEEPRDEGTGREPVSDHLQSKPSLDTLRANKRSYAGEAADVINDLSQERTEDGSAAEEEYSVQQDRQADSSVISPLESIDVQKNLRARHVPAYQGPYESAVYESGESLDAVQDSAQAGQDSTAHQAGESSRDRETNDFPGEKSNNHA